MPPRRRRRRNSSSIPPDTIDDIRRKITDQKEKIIRDFHSLNLNNCNNLFNKWSYKKRQDEEARRGNCMEFTKAKATENKVKEADSRRRE